MSVYTKDPYYGNRYLKPEYIDRLPPDLAETIRSEGMGTEPEFIIASIEYNDVIGYVRRNPMFWSLCGYVILQPESKYYGKHYDEVAEEIDVHGGLTYGEKDVDGKGMYTIGFDCCHAGDLMVSNYILLPHYKDSILITHDTYKDMYYVINEIMEMIDQL